jgi:hypothetical protein
MSYGASIADADIGELVFMPEKFSRVPNPTNCRSCSQRNFELVINLRSVKALGVAVSPGLFAIADEVIELSDHFRL